MVGGYYCNYKDSRMHEIDEQILICTCIVCSSGIMYNYRKTGLGRELSDTPPGMGGSSDQGHLVLLLLYP